MIWKIPPKIKIYEALGCIGDKRIEIKNNEAKVFSSSRKKYYSVKYDGKNSIMSNDNGSYWKEYLGYPSIAFLMLKGIIKYNIKFTELLKDISWKDFNKKFKNDFLKTEEHIKELLSKKGINIKEFNNEIENIYEQIKKLNIEMLGDKILPPKGY